MAACYLLGNPRQYADKTSFMSRTTVATSSRSHRLRHEREETAIAEKLVIGRGDACDLQVGDQLTSRRHAKLYVDARGLMVEDLGSRNGVFVNHQRVRTPTLLAHGDVVTVGRESLEVVDATTVRRDAPTVEPFGLDCDGPEPITATPLLGVLSEREREVFELLVLGHTQSEIAALLHVSVKTIESHRANIADKLECRTRAELVSYAIIAGVLIRPNR